MQKLKVWSLLVFITFAASSCGNDDNPGASDNFDQHGFLVHIGSNLILPAYADLQLKSATLQASVQSFVQMPSLSTLGEAKAALLEARLAYQYCAPYQFGPAEDLGLASNLNVFPTDKGRIESNISAGDYDLALLSNTAAKGFPAMGYLLYGEGQSEEEIIEVFTLDKQRAAYLVAIGEIIKTTADAVFRAWEPGGGNYLAEFSSPGALGADAGSSLGKLVNAMNYSLERNTRDAKVGIPAGIRSLGIVLPQATEAYHAGYSTQLALANVEAFKMLFLGNNNQGQSGLGFDDYLQARSTSNDSANSVSLDGSIIAEFDETLRLLQNIGDPLSDKIAANPEPAHKVFAQLQKLSVLLKTDMASILGVVISYQDNDGD